MEAVARERRERLATLRGQPRPPSEGPKEEERGLSAVTVEERAAQVLESTKDVATTSTLMATDDKPALAELLPRGETEDLRQHIRPRLEELEERTQTTILELVKRRLSQHQ